MATLFRSCRRPVPHKRNNGDGTPKFGARPGAKTNYRRRLAPSSSDGDKLARAEQVADGVNSDSVSRVRVRDCEPDDSSSAELFGALPTRSDEKSEHANTWPNAFLSLSSVLCRPVSSSEHDRHPTSWSGSSTTGRLWEAPTRLSVPMQTGRARRKASSRVRPLSEIGIGLNWRRSFWRRPRFNRYSCTLCRS